MSRGVFAVFGSMRDSLILFVIVLLIIVARFAVYSNDVLPDDWKEGDRVAVYGRVLSEPYHNGSKYVVRVGEFKVIFASYSDIKLGDWVRLVGTPVTQVKMGKIVRVSLIDPSVLSVSRYGYGSFSLFDEVVIGIARVRVFVMNLLERLLPEPHASLSGGILLGVKRGMPREFYDALVNTGTLHIVAASGFNVTVVLRVVMSVAVGWVGRGLGLVVGFVAVLFYVVLAGGSSAVVRAGIMGVLSYGAYYFGRPSDAKRILWITVVVMLMLSPLLFVDVGFQLSVGATAGILYLGDGVRDRMNRLLGLKKGSVVERYLADNLYTTLSASIGTVLIILWWFGRVSWISPVVNVLVLGVVPIVMLLSGLVVAVGVVWSWGGWFLSLFLYVLLEYMIRVIYLFG